MNRKSHSALLCAVALSTSVNADGAFHTASYYNSYFTSFSGTIVVPPMVASGGTPYLWPGLQPPSNDGVLQNVLDGRSEHWYYGNTWEGTPSEPYGGGFSASVNEDLGFAMVETPTGSGNWSITSSSNGNSVSYTFDIAQRMNQALFAVELYDVDWNFGNLVFNNVKVVGEGTDSSWCTANPQYSDVTIDFEGVASSVSGDYVTCTIEQVTLSPP